MGWKIMNIGMYMRKQCCSRFWWREAYLGTEEEDREINVLLKEGEKVEKNVLLPERLTAPVEKGKQVGTVNYYLNGELLREYPVLTAEDMGRLDFAWMLHYIWKQYSL